MQIHLFLKMHMNRISKLIPAVVGMLILCLAGSCFDQRKTSKLPPIANNVVGKWVIAHGFENKHGSWVEVADYDAVGNFYTFYKDGRAVISYTDNDGQTYLRETTWQADDENEIFTINGFDTQMLLLKNDSMELGYRDQENRKTTCEAVYKDCWKRVSPGNQTLAEQLIGKWNHLNSYEKKGKQWVVTHKGAPNRAYVIFGADGDLKSHTEINGRTLKAELFWSINNQTGEMFCFKEDESNTIRIRVYNDTLECVYTKNFDLETPGKITYGEYRDLFVRNK